MRSPQPSGGSQLLQEFGEIGRRHTHELGDFPVAEWDLRITLGQKIHDLHETCFQTLWRRHDPELTEMDERAADLAGMSVVDELGDGRIRAQHLQEGLGPEP